MKILSFPAWPHWTQTEQALLGMSEEDIEILFDGERIAAVMVVLFFQVSPPPFLSRTSREPTLNPRSMAVSIMTEMTSLVNSLLCWCFPSGL
jgi:hypothetical protein